MSTVTQVVEPSLLFWVITAAGIWSIVIFYMLRK